MDRRRFLAGLASATSAVVAGCVDQGQSSTPTAYDVGMRSSAFVPREFETTVGETVTWKNTNSRAHTVTAYEASLPDDAAYFATGDFDTEQAAREGYLNSLEGAIYSNETYEHTFSVPGRHDYFCIPHERGGMVGTVIVRE